MARRRSSRSVGEGPSSPALRPIEEEALREAVASLAALDLAGLRLQWRNVFGGSPPVHLAKPLLARILAYRLQADAFGDLPDTVLRMLDGFGARGSAPSGQAGGEGWPRSTLRRIKPGSILVREWDGRLHRVMALEEGFAWEARPTVASPRSRGRSPAVTGTGRGSSASPDPRRWRGRPRRSRPARRRERRVPTTTDGSPHEPTPRSAIVVRAAAQAMRQRKLALQAPRLIDERLPRLTDPRSPRLRNPDQLRRGDRCRPRPLQTRGQFWTPIRG